MPSYQCANVLMCLCLKQHAAWIIPFFCYQVFDFALNTLVAISIIVYPNTIQDYLQQLVSQSGFQSRLAPLSDRLIPLEDGFPIIRSHSLQRHVRQVMRL